MRAARARTISRVLRDLERLARDASARTSAEKSGSPAPARVDDLAELPLGELDRLARESSAARPGARSAPDSSSTPARPRSATRGRCRSRDARASGSRGAARSSSSMPTRTRPIFAIASMPRSGREPCAARPCVSISRWTKPRCATATCISVGSVTIAASARSDAATASVPTLANSSSATAVRITSPAQPAPRRLGRGEHARREAPLHVVRAAPVQPPVRRDAARTDRSSRRRRPCPCAR